MALLPGVPNVGPAPVSPTVKVGAKVSLGKPASGISAAAHSVGKPGNSEHFGSVVGRTGKGLTALGGGSSAAHSLNQYGKSSQLEGGVDPTQHAGVSQIRGGGMGKLNPHVRQGGLGPGKMSTPGPSDTDYSAQSEDVE